MANLGQFGKIYLVLLTLALRFNNMKINFFQVSIQAMIIKSHLQPCYCFFYSQGGGGRLACSNQAPETSQLQSDETTRPLGSKEWCSWNR